ncbi:Transposase (plasmid) [Nostoc flagelliforme CCNUN1]|uniref:Transposase n=1 Tax=Nostoc flagelliforme CCNUN1 TaxID=2038116 RepID=A0A2K8T764_9NOSO|nr:helix-turn-helix domain-containing protein [Nostoc flagelliforme]AUB34192.1 Transposase [Nostoc flagelliforme CCNUN1]AUB34210.1 Transposase [Nostoc flagelliforme CCNUN1]AUB34225.1 Transposase [Nostoc flagelliforme CCNUN1]AUB34242.1 Transposase [Nostoc flagelliforme CCNUN1]AUB35146.1 Transposase [Nostoc flagelliforme CCNUN1]
MLRVECDRWNESASKLREEALKANHARTRERLMALYEICNGKSATKVGRETGRNPQTVMEWVHRYNLSGIKALLYQRTGGHPPFFPQK